MPTPTDPVERANRARRFPANTCGASRHAQDVAEAMMRREVYPEVTEDPPHIGASILATVEALYEARSTIERLQAENQALRDQISPRRLDDPGVSAALDEMMPRTREEAFAYLKERGYVDEHGYPTPQFDAAMKDHP